MAGQGPDELARLALAQGGVPEGAPQWGVILGMAVLPTLIAVPALYGAVARLGAARVNLRAGAVLRAVEHGALALHHVLQRAHLLLAALAFLGVLALAVLGPAGLQLLQQALQLRHLVAGLLVAALAGGLAHLLHHAVQVALVELGRAGVIGQLGALAPGLLGQGLQVALDGLLQLAHLLVQLGPLLVQFGLLALQLGPAFGRLRGVALRIALITPAQNTDIYPKAEDKPKVG